LLARLNELTVGTWTAADASDWWEEYGPALAPAEGEPAATGKTIDVDLEHHQ